MLVQLLEGSITTCKFPVDPSVLKFVVIPCGCFVPAGQVGAMLLGITPPGSQMLLPAAKMLYTLSKDSSNDSRFRHHGVLRPLLCLTAALSSAVAQHQQQHTTTVLLYCSGCLKNISTDVTNQKSLGRLGGVSTMAKVGASNSGSVAWASSAETMMNAMH